MSLLSEAPSARPSGLWTWVRRPASAGVLVALLLAGLLVGCNAAQPEQKTPVIKVEVTPPIGNYEVLDFQDFTGRLDGYRNIDIKARVSGYLETVNFKEGDIVKQGDLLFLIDPKPLQADLDVAVGDLNVAIAEWDNQQKMLARDKKLVGTVAVSQEQYELDKANEAKAKATVLKMEAARDKAQLYLDYTRVIAPVSRRYVDPGNDVIGDNTMLTSIVTVNPVYANFDVDERTYLDLQKRQTPRALMRLATEKEYTHLGDVDFIDNRVNANAGTIRMRALFDYIQGLDVGGAATGAALLPSLRVLQKLPAILYPGLFCRVRVPVGEPYKAFLIPDEAVMTDQGRKYVLVVKIDETTITTDEKSKKRGKGVVEYRPVEVGQLIDSMRVIRISKDPKTGQPDPKIGLTGGKDEYVIVKGQQRVKLNTTQKQDVEAVINDEPKPPASPLGPLFHQGQ
jgi:RND family efflux transporter MFP subunit